MRFIRERKRLLFLFLLVLALPLVTAFALDSPSLTGQVFSPTPFPSPTYPPYPQPTPTFIPSPFPMMSPEIQYINLNEVVQSQLSTNGLPVQHYFEGRQGQFVVVNVATSEPIGYSFYLADVNGYTIQEVARYGTGLMAFLPYDSTFMVTFSSYYEYGSPVDYSLVVATPESTEIQYGDSLSLSLTAEHPVSAFKFQGQQGDLVNLNAGSLIYNLTTLLIDPVYNYVMADSRYTNGAPFPGTGGISLSSLPTTQEYLVVVFSEYLSEPIDFTLNLKTVEPVVIEGYGVAVNGRFDETTQVAYYNFNGQYGDIIDITLTSDDDIDTLISLYGPNNMDYRLTDDDSGSGDDPEILNYLINPEGIYMIEVQPFNTGVSGEYSLTISLSTRTSLDNGARRVDLGKNPQQHLSFSASAGEQIRLEVQVINGFMPLLNISQQNALIANIGMGELRTFVTEFTVPNDGAVLVSLSPNHYYSPNTTVEVMIDRLAED